MAQSSRRPGRHSGSRGGEDRRDGVSDSEATESLTPDGEALARGDLADPPVDVVDQVDDQTAEELTETGDDDETADEEQLDDATEEAREAASSVPKPVRRNQTVAPVRKTKPTPKRDDAPAKRKRTTPVAFTKQSVGELKKVVWPSASTVRQYFLVVLVFVLFIMGIVAGLDALFGWLLLKALG
ncbi:hypothetical protein GCM10009785_05910 [Brooklawnia cerclae]|uniref:Protein translocase subunit SecE n=1 Tax=Brooklawnia cerclae TaxID=349934 RepID=A0ABX0SCX0_9ACTN|nr:preprotein translocase subunit SecE [Brooklawnia cerclae]